MAFKFHNANTIYSNSHWRNECNNNPGGPGGVISQSMLVNAKEAELNFERARMWARKKTSTGYRLMEAVRNSSTIINVVAWRSTNPVQPGFSMFSNDSPRVNEGTIYVNLDQLVSVAVPNREDQNKNTMFNNFLLILHEIGHAKQFIDNPSWFRSNQNTADYIAGPKEHVLEMLALKTGKKWGIEAKANRILGNAHKKFSSAIEWENYIYHEGPICDEIGVARRVAYSNLDAHFGDTDIGGGVTLV